MIYPLDYYMRSGKPDTRVTWLCLRKFKEHYLRATGLEASEYSKAFARNKKTYLEHPLKEEDKLTDEERKFVDEVLFKEDFDFHKRLCTGNADGPFVTDGAGEVLGQIAEPSSYEVPWLPPKK